jgi:hypothetical protein
MPMRFFYTARRHLADGRHYFYFEVPNAFGPGAAFTRHSVHPDVQEAERALKISVDECREKLKKRWGKDSTLEPALADSSRLACQPQTPE